nr:putative reverse transcriptase domain-containing protein [Tanacetum cinerariifolium]
MARCRSRHHHLCQQVLDVSKDEGRLLEAIWFNGTTRNTPLEMGNYSHGFYYKTTKDNKQSRHDLGNWDHQKELCQQQLSRVHSTFHVSKFKKCMAEEPLAIPLDEIQVDDKLNFIEEPVEIMDREVKRLKQSRIPIVKQLSRVHSTFHVSNLKKCLSDEPIAIPLDEIHVDDKLNFIEEPVEIMEREVKRLKQRRIPIMKVRWNSRRGPEYTWEREDQMQKKYPHLFAREHFLDQ